MNEETPTDSPTLPEEAGGGDVGGSVAEDTSEEVFQAPDQGDAEPVDYEKKIEELERRVSGQTRSWQEERARAEKAESELQKYDRYKDVIDFSELDGYLDEESAAGETLGQTYPGQQYQDPQISQLQTQLQYLQQKQQYMELENLENSYARTNPQHAHIFRDTELHEKCRGELMKICQQEYQTHGQVVSSPQQILEQSVNKTIAFSNKLKLEGARMESEKRRKIDSTGVGLGGGEKPTKSSSVDEEDKPLSRSDYIDLQRTGFDVTKSVVPPDGSEGR